MPSRGENKRKARRRKKRVLQCEIGRAQICLPTGGPYASRPASTKWFTYPTLSPKPNPSPIAQEISRKEDEMRRSCAPNRKTLLACNSILIIRPRSFVAPVRSCTFLVSLSSSRTAATLAFTACGCIEVVMLLLKYLVHITAYLGPLLYVRPQAFTNPQCTIGYRFHCSRARRLHTAVRAHHERANRLTPYTTSIVHYHHDNWRERCAMSRSDHV